MQIELPYDVHNIIERLNSCGHEAYAVGGCVRDTVLGNVPADWDITTSARPDEIKRIFARTVDTGIEHGTVTVLTEGGSYEVTTYRIDGKYEDGRHPDSVEFTASLEEDLARRDFTINAMAYNERSGLVDIFGGIDDLKRGVIRCVGEPSKRFGEDALRMLRALRFAAQLGFDIDYDTYEAICELSPNIEKVSKERIMVELVKLLVSAHPDKMRDVSRCGLSRYFFPELDEMFATPQNNKHHSYNVGEHTMHALVNIPADRVLRLTMLLHDIGKPSARTTDGGGNDHFKRHQEIGAAMSADILRRLKFDNDTVRIVSRLVLYHDERPPCEERAIRRLAVRMGEECFPAIFAVKRADTMAQSMYMRDEKLAYIDCMERMYNGIVERRECLAKRDLYINGRDLIAMGARQGRLIGEILDSLFMEIVDYPERNDRGYLLRRAEEMLEEEMTARVKKADGMSAEETLTQ